MPSGLQGLALVRLAKVTRGIAKGRGSKSGIASEDRIEHPSSGTSTVSSSIKSRGQRLSMSTGI